MMKLRRATFLLLGLLVLIVTACRRTAEVTHYAVIPEPLFVNYTEGSYTLTSSVTVFFDNISQNAPTVKFVTSAFRKLHFHPNLVGSSTEDALTFRINGEVNSELGEEGYLLDISVDGISISANTETGLFYGFQTLLQLLPSDVYRHPYKSVILPCGTILDSPTFSWRGCQLDVAHYFLSPDEVKRYLDLLASYKFNHCLLQVVAPNAHYRIESSWADLATNPLRNDEMYSADDIVDILNYAEELHIEVVPMVVVDSAMLLRLGETRLRQFQNLQMLADDVGNSFKTGHVMISVSDTVLQHQVADYILASGRQLVVDESAGVYDNSVVVCQSNQIPSLVGTKTSEILFAPASYCSFDRYQSDSAYHVRAHPGYLPLSRVYRFAPMLDALPYNKMVIGSMVTMQSDLIANLSQFDYMLLPRLCAFSEALWTSAERKDWPRFRRAVEGHKQRLADRGYAYCEGSFRPILHVVQRDSMYEVVLECEVPETQFRYTIDSNATADQFLTYQGAIMIPLGATLRIAPHYKGENFEGIYTFHLE